MSALIQNPFNFQPSSITRGLNTSYTVPAGKHAIITFFASGTAYVSSGSASLTAGGNGLWPTTDSFNLAFPVYLRAGDTITATKTNASASGSGSAFITTGVTTIAITVNGTTVINFRARSTSYNHSQGGTGSTSIGGDSDFGFVAHEYNVI